MTQRRAPQPQTLGDARTPADDSGDINAGIYTSVDNRLRDQFFLDYRPFGGSFYGRFFTQSLNESNGQNAMGTEYVTYDDDFSPDKSYDVNRTSPIESEFSYQLTNAKGFPEPQFGHPSVEWNVGGGISGTTSMYLAVRWSADADPAPYNLTAYQKAVITDTNDTYHEYRTVSSFPTTVGYTFSNMTDDNDNASHHAYLYGPSVDIGMEEVMPMTVDRWTVSLILQTPDGSPVTPSTGTFGSFEISTTYTSHRFTWFETQDQYRRITEQTPISQHDDAIYTTRN